jgi:hypothetical protein
MIFKTDADEVQGTAAPTANTNESAVLPSGNIGFSLKYTQVAC